MLCRLVDETQTLQARPNKSELRILQKFAGEEMTPLEPKVNGQLRIDEMFAFIACDETGEGVTGMMMPNGQWIPLVGADMKRVESLMPHVRDMALATGKEIKLVKFTNRIEMETIK